MTSSTEHTYHGNCHCGAFKYTLTLPAPITHALNCTCSICTRHGFIFTFAPGRDALKITKGSIDATLKSYSFGPRTRTFYFCPHCGTPMMCINPTATDPKYSLALNVRAFHDIDLERLQIGVYDGAAVGEPWVPHTPIPAEEHVLAGNVHNGSCHCGAVRVAVVAPPGLEGCGVWTCNCSLCRRRGFLWMYPPPQDVVMREKQEGVSLTPYYFGERRGTHTFCSTCGVSVINMLTQPNRAFLKTPVNVRCLEGLDIGALQKRAEMLDFASREPQYVVPE
ncbi:glutathione-dependent formaldehyde-activating enzyme [Geopyxis carbonaria]|nr:glutathione-dependent formaldehyde-activating enzyme [Geopyxis carbonaria]